MGIAKHVRPLLIAPALRLTSSVQFLAGLRQRLPKPPKSPKGKDVKPKVKPANGFSVAPIVLTYPSQAKAEEGADLAPVERTYLIEVPSTSGLVTQYQVRAV